jgi:hypothetical protein
MKGSVMYGTDERDIQFTLEQALKAQTGSRGLALLFV